jgi:hypothetical protein
VGEALRCPPYPMRGHYLAFDQRTRDDENDERTSDDGDGAATNATLSPCPSPSSPSHSRAASDLTPLASGHAAPGQEIHEHAMRSPDD